MTSWSMSPQRADGANGAPGNGSPEALIAGRPRAPEMEPGWYGRYERWEATPVLREWIEQPEEQR
jgi:hypothetical protein